MANETVFTVTGTTAKVAHPVGLAEAGLGERNQLQEWVVSDPRILGADMKVVSFEFGRGPGLADTLERDRLDVLALDRQGRLVVVELARDKAADTVEMQALKYTALASRFTRAELNRVHAGHLSHRRGGQVDADAAAAELDEWATITAESLRLPRIVLMASGFPKTVTATVVFLHQQLALDVRLMTFQAYRTDTGEVLITVSQHYPPSAVEEFDLPPESGDAEQTHTEPETPQREALTVSRLVGAGVLEPGERLQFRVPDHELEAQVEPWLAAQPSRRWATWEDDPTRPLRWDADGQSYTSTGLARLILSQAAHRDFPVQGPAYWINSAGTTLLELTRGVDANGEVPFEQAVDSAALPLQQLLLALDKAILELGPDITRRAKQRQVIYYGQKELCDVTLHGEHLSVYIRNLPLSGPYPPGFVVGGNAKYIHTRIRDQATLNQVIALLARAYADQPR